MTQKNIQAGFYQAKQPDLLRQNEALIIQVVVEFMNIWPRCQLVVAFIADVDGLEPRGMPSVVGKVKS